MSRTFPGMYSLHHQTKIISELGTTLTVTSSHIPEDDILHDCLLFFETGYIYVPSGVYIFW
jgi:hypothetical protein